MALPSKAPTVLMTGSRGFTGNHLGKALRAKNYEVHGLGREKSTSPFEHCVDLSNQKELAAIIQKIQPNYIIHLAAVSFVAHGEAKDFYETNLFGTLNLLEAIQGAGVYPEKILIASSANVYGNPTQTIITEEVSTLPVNHYGNSKLAMENMVRQWFERFPIVMTRPFNYTGIGQSENFLIPKIVAHFKAKKKLIKLGNIDVVRDISGVNLVVDSYMRLLEHPVHSDIFNICSSVGYSIEAILEMLQEMAGYTIQVEVDPNLVRASEIKKLIGSNQKFCKIVGDVKTLPLSETLKSMYSYSQ